MSERDNLGPGLEIPDLELEPSVSKRPVPSTPRGPALPAPSAAGAGSRQEIDLFAGGEDDFELVRTGSKVELAGEGPPAETSARAPSAVWPTGRSLAADQLAIDALEVALVAGYGSAPKTALLAPAYAYRVFARRRLLKRAIAEHHAALVHEENERDAALAELASDMRGTLEASDSFRRLLEPIREVERLAGDRHAALSEADAGFREHMAKFDEELGQLDAATAQAAALVAEKSQLADGTGNELRRADAKHKRVQIEMRGVLELARQAVGPAGGDIPAAQAAQLSELQARLAALEPELLSAKAVHAAASSEAEQAQAELRRLESRTRQLQRQKATASGSLSQQLSLRAAGVSEAEQQRRQALAEVARAVLSARGAVAVPEATLEALRAHDARVKSHAVRLETHVRALDSQHHERVRQGIIVTLSALGVVVLAIVLKAVL